jgi:hypothetical protein
MRGALVRAGAVGIGAGVVWGVLARVWMRLVTDSPEFSWFGSLMIVALAAFHGLVTALAVELLRQGRSGWWRLLAVPGLLLFAGPGMLFLPALVVGGVALARLTPARVLVALAAVSVTPVILWQKEKLDEYTMLSAPTSMQVWTLVGMPLLGLALAWRARGLFAPRARTAQSDSPDLARNNLRSESSLAVPAGPA